MPWRLGSHGPEGGTLAAVLPPRLRLIPRYGRLAVCALLWLDPPPLIDFFHRAQGARMARGTRGSAATSITPRALWPFVRGRVARRGAGSMRGGLVQLFLYCTDLLL